MLSNWKWYRKKKGGKWYHLYHKGIHCEGWFKDPTVISFSEHVDYVEDYTTVIHSRQRKLKELNGIFCYNSKKKFKKLFRLFKNKKKMGELL
jgi:hypothetical protein